MSSDCCEPCVFHHLHGKLLPVDGVFRTRPTVGPPVQVELHGLVGGWQASAGDGLLMKTPNLNWKRTPSRLQNSLHILNYPGTTHGELLLAIFLLVYEEMFINIHCPSQINCDTLALPPEWPLFLMVARKLSW